MSILLLFVSVIDAVAAGYCFYFLLHGVTRCYVFFLVVAVDDGSSTDVSRR